MPTKTIYPHNVTETTGGHYVPFRDIATIKNKNNQYAESNTDIEGKSKNNNRPSTLICKDFRCNLPEGSIVNSIKVELHHAKTGESNQKSCNILAPNIRLIYNGHTITGKLKENGASFSYLKKGQAPKMVHDNSTSTFNGYQDKKHYELPNINILNNSTFGVQIEYPTNANEYTGKLRVYWVSITVTYTLSTFTLSMAKAITAGPNRKPYRLQLRISRNSKTRYIPKVTLISPTGMTFVRVDDMPKEVMAFKQINNHTFEWTPQLKNTIGVSSDRIQLEFLPEVTFSPSEDSKTLVFTASQSLSSGTVNHNAIITPDIPEEEPTPDTTDEPIIDDEDTDPLAPIVMYVEQNEEFYINYGLDDYVGDTLDYVVQEMYWWDTPIDPDQHTTSKFKEWDDYLQVWLTAGFRGTFRQTDLSAKYKITNPGRFRIQLWTLDEVEDELVHDQLIREVRVECFSNDLSPPHLVILKPNQEELNRLGNGYAYAVQSYIKITNEDEDFVRDWRKNFRVGVFNNAIAENVRDITVYDEDGNPQIIHTDSTNYDTLSLAEIVDNAEYWSNQPSAVGSYGNCSCQFMYDKDYPLYILITGDFPEANLQHGATISFTEPCIVEATEYTGWEAKGLYPAPILNLTDENDTATLGLEGYQQSSGIVLYDFPLEDNFGTSDLVACRGIAVTGNVEQANKQVLYAKLKSPNGDTGSRSIIISDYDTQVDNDNSFTIGGAGDLFNYGLLDMTQLEDWEIELIFSNIVDGITTNINLNNIKIDFYMETVEQQNIDTYINDENIAFYNAFITELNIPPGLQTDVDYLNVDGTDINDAYRQTSKKKQSK